jgi:hypothetical protein
MLGLYPKSAIFDTLVMNCIIVGSSGDLINFLYTKRVSLAYKVAYKSARYMDAKNGA